MSEYSVKWRVGDTIVDEAAITTLTPLQAARVFAVGEGLAVEVSTRRFEGAALVWSVRNEVGHAAGALIVL